MRTQSHADPLSIGDALAPTMPAVAVLVSATVAMTWRVLSSKPSQSPDAWAYLAWGQALLRGERPLYDHALTTPKPLGMLLGVLVEPLPPDRGFQLAVIALLGVMAAALYWVAFQQAGTVGAVVALACLGLSAVIGSSLKFGLIDGAAAGLVMLAIATRGRRRLACLILAGLARPEAWLLAGVAAYSQATGGFHRRLAFGLFSAAIAPLIWLTADLAFAGDPLASSDRADAIVSIMNNTRPALSSMPRHIAIATARDIGGFTAAAGLAGVILLAIRNHRRGSVDPLVTAVLVGWPAAVLVETRDVPFQSRYLFPMMMPLLVGCAVICGAVLRGRRLGGAWLAAGCASIAFALAVVVSTPPSSGAARPMTAELTAISGALRCGALEVYAHSFGSQTGARQATVLIPQLAALTRHSLHDFVIGPSPRHLSGLLWLGRRHVPHRPHWIVRHIPLGTLAVTPACAAAAKK